MTHCNLNYQGSLVVDEEIMDELGFLPNEKVLVLNISNNARWDTYIIPGERGSKHLKVVGAAARAAQVGDLCIIISWAQMTLQEAKEFKPKVKVIEP